MTKIYIAHAMKDYDSEFIGDVMHNVVKQFGNDVELVNPEEYEHLCIKGTGYTVYKRNMNKVFFPIISDCDIMVVVPYSRTSNVSAGVREEIKCAKHYDIEIYFYPGYVSEDERDEARVIAKAKRVEEIMFNNEGWERRMKVEHEEELIRKKMRRDAEQAEIDNKQAEIDERRRILWAQDEAKR